jgi:hypothetical protein
MGQWSWEENGAKMRNEKMNGQAEKMGQPIGNANGNGTGQGHGLTLKEKEENWPCKWMPISSNREAEAEAIQRI